MLRSAFIVVVMKVLHLPSTFWPDAAGGKEIFVYQLIKSLPSEQHSVLIHRKGQPGKYVHDGIDVNVLPLPETRDTRRSYFEVTFDRLPGFEEFLDDYKPDIVHLHDFGNYSSLSHLRVCKLKGIKTVSTYHSPGQSCLQRALIFGGKKPCSGKIDIDVCTKCRYLVAGVPEIAAAMMSKVRQPFSPLNKFFQRGDTQLYHDSWHEFYNGVDLIQVHAHWVKDVLLINDIPSDKIKYVEMGGHASSSPRKEDQNGPLRLVFVGRCTDIKGVHLLVDAVKSLPDAPLEVHFFGPYWNDDYGRRLQEKMGDDKRFIPPRLIDSEKIVEELKSMDICVIPSIWPETGPLTLFDSFAAGVPILGTRLAGIEEKARDGVDRVLFNWNDVNDLRDKLSMLLNDRNKVEEMKRNIKPNRTFSDFAKDIDKLYHSVVNSK